MEKSYNENGHLVIKNLSIYLQMIFVGLIIIFGIIYLFIPEILVLLELSLVAFLFISAYNNKQIYKKNVMTFVYALAGILYLISIILEVIGK